LIDVGTYSKKYMRW